MALAPLYISDALHLFLTDQRERFGTLNGPMGGPNLIDSLEVGLVGYLQRDTLSRLMRIYALRNNILDPNNSTYIIPDDYMQTYFNGEIPALFYYYRDNFNKINKMLMVDAIEEGIIQAPMNTFQVIQNCWPEFNPAHFPTFFIINIISVNSLSTGFLDQHLNIPEYAMIYENINSPNINAKMQQENQMVQNALSLWE
jgi:hypothetical protein